MLFQWWGWNKFYSGKVSRCIFNWKAKTVPEKWLLLLLLTSEQTLMWIILWCKSHNICQFFLCQMHEVFVLSWLVVPKTLRQLLTIFWIMTFWLGIVLGIIRQTRCIFFWSLLSNILIFSTVSFQMPPPSTPTKRYVLMKRSGPN